MSKKDFIKYECEDSSGYVTAQLTYLTDDSDGVIAYGQIIIANMVAVKVSLWHTKDGKDFFSLPSRKGKDGNYYNDVIPMNKEVAKAIRECAEDCVDWYFEQSKDSKKNKKR